MSYNNRQELADKMDWEGGLHEFIFGYGLSATDLPEGDIELHDAFIDLWRAKITFDAAADKFVDLLPSPSGE